MRPESDSCNGICLILRELKDPVHTTVFTSDPEPHPALQQQSLGLQGKKHPAGRLAPVHKTEKEESQAMVLT